MWFDGIFKDIPEVTKYRFCRVIFGAYCSQYLLNSVIHFHARKYKNVDKEFSEKVAERFYADDFNSTAKDIYEIQANDQVKVLGIVWDTKSDHLVFCFENLIESFNNIIPTKHNILSLIAKFYDPIDLVQPIIIKLKLLFQEMCVTHAYRDIEISEQLKDKFDFIVKFVKTLTTVKVFRCYFYGIVPRHYIVTDALHESSDALEKAYGCCLYLKRVTKKNFISTLLVASKTRVALHKNKITISRLDLLGNLISSCLILTVLNSFKGDTDISSLYAWPGLKVWKKVFCPGLNRIIKNLRLLFKIEL